jgi:hypothetical protein
MTHKAGTSIVGEADPAMCRSTVPRNNRATWQIVFIYPRFFLISPFFGRAVRHSALAVTLDGDWRLGLRLCDSEFRRIASAAEGPLTQPLSGTPQHVALLE